MTRTHNSLNALPNSNHKTRRRSKAASLACAPVMLLSCGDYSSHAEPDVQSAEGPTELERVADTRAPVVAATPPPPITGGSLLVLDDGNTAVAADPARDTVHFVDIDAGQVLTTIALQKGAQPTRVAQSPNKVHLALSGSGQVLTLDTAGNTLWQADVCAEPRSLEYLPTRSAVLVACRDGKLLSVSTADGQVEAFSSLPTDLKDVLVVPSKTEGEEPSVYVSRFRSAELLQVNMDGSIANARTVPDMRMMQERFVAEETPEGRPASELVKTTFTADVAWRARVVNGEVFVLHQRAQRGEVSISVGGYGGSDGCERVVGSGVSKIGPEAVLTGATLSSVNVGVDLAISPDGTWWAIADAGVPDPDTPRGFVNAPGEMNGPPGFPLPGPDSDSRLMLPYLNSPVQIFRAGGAISEVTDLGVICGPGPTTSLTGTPGQQATAVEFNPTREAQLLALLRQPAVLLIQDDFEVGTVPRRVELGGVDITDTGHDLFHRVDARVACVQCHPGGAEDGQVWAFEGVGARRTQSLDVALRPPFHWDGEFDDMNELMTEVFVGRMRAAPQSPERIASLAGWLSSLPTPRGAVTITDPVIERGRELFESAAVGCANCHSGDTLTDGALHQVGTSDVALKTPSLVGVAQRQPFMHDGCAATLRERFSAECGGGDQHGFTSHLSSEDIDSLTAYLESL